MRKFFDYNSGEVVVNEKRCDEGYWISGSRRVRVLDTVYNAKGHKLPVATFIARASKKLGGDVTYAKAMARQLHKLGYIRIGRNPGFNTVSKHGEGFSS